MQKERVSALAVQLASLQHDSATFSVKGLGELERNMRIVFAGWFIAEF